MNYSLNTTYINNIKRQQRISFNDMDEHTEYEFINMIKSTQYVTKFNWYHTFSSKTNSRKYITNTYNNKSNVSTTPKYGLSLFTSNTYESENNSQKFLSPNNNQSPSLDITSKLPNLSPSPNNNQSPSYSNKLIYHTIPSPSASTFDEQKIDDLVLDKHATFNFLCSTPPSQSPTIDSTPISDSTSDNESSISSSSFQLYDDNNNNNDCVSIHKHNKSSSISSCSSSSFELYNDDENKYSDNHSSTDINHEGKTLDYIDYNNYSSDDDSKGNWDKGDWDAYDMIQNAITISQKIAAEESNNTLQTYQQMAADFLNGVNATACNKRGSVLVNGTVLDIGDNDDNIWYSKDRYDDYDYESNNIEHALELIEWIKNGNISYDNMINKLCDKYKLTNNEWTVEELVNLVWKELEELYENYIEFALDLIRWIDSSDVLDNNIVNKLCNKYRIKNDEWTEQQLVGLILKDVLKRLYENYISEHGYAPKQFNHFVNYVRVKYTNITYKQIKQFWSTL